MTDYMRHIIETYRKAKKILYIASDADNTSEGKKIISGMSLKELEEISRFVRDLEEHGILDQIQEVTN